ncbi:hypothetical protein TIFTF001_038093 [Ficus carica]|uniref:Uncharacterized protein n=1 Tax=Ficus carica TaxID=3494 RepID=A0AA88E6P2_FICCA|nr:hypothetical protein TIFTF001_038093 [Ficus carica]
MHIQIKLAMSLMGESVKKLNSQVEKLLSFNEVLKDCSGEGEHLTAYLLEAVMGIEINSSAGIRKLAFQFGVKLCSLPW